MSSRWPVFSLVSMGLLAGACATGEPVVPPRPRPHAVTMPVPKQPPAPEWTHWVGIDTSIRGDVHGLDLPIADAQIVRLERAEERWTQAPEAVRDHVRRLGFAVVPGDMKRTRLGEYYLELREQRVPFVMTLDAMFALAHLAVDRAIAEVEAEATVPALDRLLARCDLRLTAEAQGASSDLAAAYAVARGLVSVARQLMSADYRPAPELAAVVAVEVARVVAHTGPAESALLGVTLDYSAMAPRGALALGDARLTAFRAMAWLGQAPLMLAARSEIAGAPANVSRARAHTRAALLIARLLLADVDAEAAHAWERIAQATKFVGGAPDDLTPLELAALAAKAGLDVHDTRAIANVARIDRVRHVAMDGRLPRVYDGAGGLRVSVPTPAIAEEIATTGGASGVFPRAALSARLFAPSSAPDAQALQALVFPAVGALTSGSATPPVTAFESSSELRRVMPTALDVAAWLGSPEARALLHDSGDDAYAGFDAALERAYKLRPSEDQRHVSLHATMLDAIATYLAGSAADESQPGANAPTSQWRRRKLEVALGAWTMLRHDDDVFTRVPSTPVPATQGPAVHVAPGNSSPAPGFVEAHPEAIARLVAFVRQARDGLKVGGTKGDSPAGVVLAEVDIVLSLCLRVALAEANDEPLDRQDADAMVDLPARLAALDARLTGCRSADLTIATDVHVDLGSARVLEEGTGYLDDIYLLVREPGSGQTVLAVGASLGHYELAQPSALRFTDEAWRAKLRTTPPPRHSLSAGYVVVRE